MAPNRGCKPAGAVKADVNECPMQPAGLHPRFGEILRLDCTVVLEVGVEPTCQVNGAGF